MSSDVVAVLLSDSFGLFLNVGLCWQFCDFFLVMKAVFSSLECKRWRHSVNWLIEMLLDEVEGDPDADDEDIIDESVEDDLGTSSSSIAFM
jgi:hypothetical protein